ncbi:MAG: hypothetical protein DYG94_12845 [Leptolyngbya sp. PLA3]|nr:MAG: hypothetical protein EDM82_12305 [Cyanobacteria bacterium CYA]MCE7969612.1 hypothetical protein [Leptolyngbya sp. PL-A3]
MTARRTLLLRWMACAGVLAPAALAVFSTAQSQPEVALGAPQGSDLESLMDAMNGHLKFIALNLSDPDMRPRVLEHVHDMQRLAWTAKTRTPAAVAGLPEADRAGAQLEFRRRMNEVLIECCRLEMHVIDGQAADAWNVIKGPLLKLRERGHDRFQEQDGG